MQNFYFKRDLSTLKYLLISVFLIAISLTFIVSIFFNTNDFFATFFIELLSLIVLYLFIGLTFLAATITIPLTLFILYKKDIKESSIILATQTNNFYILIRRILFLYFYFFSVSFICLLTFLILNPDNFEYLISELQYKRNMFMLFYTTLLILTNITNLSLILVSYLMTKLKSSIIIFDFFFCLILTIILFFQVIDFQSIYYPDGLVMPLTSMIYYLTGLSIVVYIPLHTIKRTFSKELEI